MPEALVTAASAGRVGSMTLPNFQTDDKDFQLLQNAWAQQINPVLSNPSLKNLLLKGVSLTTGVNVINHRLGRTMQGWRVVDIDAVATIYRSAVLNDLTLTLTVSAPCVVAIEVF